MEIIVAISCLVFLVAIFVIIGWTIYRVRQENKKNYDGYINFRRRK